jgi:hypothetical protein
MFSMDLTGFKKWSNCVSPICSEHIMPVLVPSQGTHIPEVRADASHITYGPAGWCNDRLIDRNEMKNGRFPMLPFLLFIIGMN